MMRAGRLQRHVWALVTAVVVAGSLLLAACGSSGPTEADVAHMVEGGTAGFNVTCVRSDERKFICDAGGTYGAVRLEVLVAESGDKFIVTGCELMDRERERTENAYDGNDSEPRACRYMR